MNIQAQPKAKMASEIITSCDINGFNIHPSLNTSLILIII